MSTKFNRLGSFEEIVLLAIGVLGDDAYGVSVKHELMERTGKAPSIGALHSALSRLEKKGYISSREGGATAERGGRRKRFYQLTGEGERALLDGHRLRSQMLGEIKFQ